MEILNRISDRLCFPKMTDSHGHHGKANAILNFLLFHLQ